MTEIATRIIDKYIHLLSMNPIVLKIMDRIIFSHDAPAKAREFEYPFNEINTIMKRANKTNKKNQPFVRSVWIYWNKLYIPVIFSVAFVGRIFIL